jgi:hypothetical protein
VHLKGGQVEGLGALPLDLAVIEPRTRGKVRLGDGIREGHALGQAHVALHHRGHGVGTEHHDVPRIGGPARGPTVRREEDVNWRLHHRAGGEDQGVAVAEGGGVLPDDGRRGGLDRQPAQRILDQFRSLGQQLGQRTEPGAGRQAGELRESRLEPSVGKDQARPFRVPEEERGKVGGGQGARRAHRAQLRSRDRGQVGEAPVLVPGGGQAEPLEAGRARTAELGHPLRLGGAWCAGAGSARRGHAAAPAGSVSHS